MAKDKFEHLEESIKSHITGAINVVNTKIDGVNTFITDQKKTNDQLFSKANSNTVAVEKVKSSLSTTRVLMTLALAAISVAVAVIIMWK